MSSTTISEATRIIHEAAMALDDLYWEASTIEHKDLVYNLIINLKNEELELNKVSVQDGHYRYEPVSEHFRQIGAQLRWLSTHLNAIAKRTETSSQIGLAIQQLIALLS